MLLCAVWLSADAVRALGRKEDYLGGLTHINCTEFTKSNTSISRSAVITQIAKMDIDGSMSYSSDSQPSSGSKIIDVEKNSSEKDASNPLFVNHAEIAWHARRRAWVGDKSRKPIQRLSEPLTRDRDISCSWNTTYKDLELFSVAIPLADIVDCLYKDWLDEGLHN